jgi:hypothetical protein
MASDPVPLADCYVYGFVSGGHRGRLLFEELHSALYMALTDLHQGNGREPIGIRQGKRVLYWRNGLEQLYTEHRAALAAREDYEVIQRLEQLQP